MTRTLITGGAGFIGSHLVEALAKRDEDVVILDDFSSGIIDNLKDIPRGVEVIQGNILDLDRLGGRIGAVDHVVHLAALISGHDSLDEPDAYFRVNVEGTQRVVDFAKRSGAKRILFASSSTVYGNRGSAALDETTLPNPLSVYALTKLAAEHLIGLYAEINGFSHCSLRLFNVYGPRQSFDHPYANVTCKFSHAAANGLAVKRYGDGEQSRDFVYVTDVVKAFLSVFDGSESALYNVGTGEVATINQLLATVGDIAGRAPVVEQCSAWPNDIRSIRADVSRLFSEFGYTPSVTLPDGLRRTVDYFTESSHEPTPA